MPYASIRIHPGLSVLLRYQAVARLCRMALNFCSPRKIVFSLLGVILAGVWLSNAMLSILYREAIAWDQLRLWVPVGLFAYAAWHVVKASAKRPEESIEWTEAEREWLLTAPLPRRQLLLYRFSSIAIAAWFKAACFTLLMLPDLPEPLVGFVGALLALLFLDLWRMLVENIAWGAEDRTFRAARTVVWTTLGVTALYAGGRVLSAGADSATLANPVSLLLQLSSAAAELLQTPAGRVVAAPFHIFGHVITARAVSVDLAGWLVLAGFQVLALAVCLLKIDAAVQHDVAFREKARYLHSQEQSQGQAISQSGGLRFSGWATRFAVSAVAWRQAVGADRYRMSVFVALAAPAVLSCTPLMMTHDPDLALRGVAAALAFYSFLLVPAALKFDFRRDLERFPILKALPLSPWTIVIGQLVVPVMLTCGLQAIVLAFTWCVRPADPVIFLTTWALLLPVNILIFGLENLIFLVYPYRLNQEGLEVFVRATLTFTAKGLLFGIALGLTIAWAFLAAFLTDQVREVAPALGDPLVVFVTGLIGLLLFATILTIWAVTRVWKRFECS